MVQHLLDAQRGLEETMANEALVRIRKDTDGASSRAELADSKVGSTFYAMVAGVMVVIMALAFISHMEM